MSIEIWSQWVTYEKKGVNLDVEKGKPVTHARQKYIKLGNVLASSTAGLSSHKDTTSVIDSIGPLAPHIHPQKLTWNANIGVL